MIDGHVHIEKQPYTLELINQMVEVAAMNNIDELYILDHTHKFNEFKFLYSNLKGDLSKSWYKRHQTISINEYIDFISLVKQRKWPIKLHFGLEVCYFEEHEQVLKKELEKYPSLDFLIGSVHFVDGVGIDINPSIYNDLDVDIFYKRFFEITESLIKSKLFTFLGHPDSIKIFNIYPKYSLIPYYKRIAMLLNEYNLETENNTKLHYSGHTDEVGINTEFYNILVQNGVKIHKSSDAHKYTDIGREFDLEKSNI